MKHLRLPFIFDGLVTANDWDMTYGTGWYGFFGPSQDKDRRWIKLAHKTEKVEVVVNYDLKRKRNKWDDSFSGSTFYIDAEGEKCSFDRTGVEDSFYVARRGCKKTYGYNTFEEVAAGELKRVQETLARIKAAGGFISVPDIGFRVTKASKDEKTAALKAGKSISFTPGGFGIGYTLFTNGRLARRYGYGCHAASEALKNFFDVSELYYLENDCD